MGLLYRLLIAHDGPIYRLHERASQRHSNTFHYIIHENIRPVCYILSDYLKTYSLVNLLNMSIVIYLYEYTKIMQQAVS